MKFSQVLILPLLATFLFTQCKSPIKSFEKGDYRKSYSLALKVCQKGKCSRQNRTIIERSLAAIVEKGTQDLETSQSSEQVEYWERGIEISQDLQQKIEESQRFVDPIFLTKIDGLVAQEMTLRVRAADTYFEEGLDHLAYAVRYDNAQAARNAYASFQTADGWSPEPLEIDSLLREAIRYGTITINVEADMSFGISYDWDINRVFEDVEELSTQFNRISYEKTGSGFDCEIEVDFDRPEITFREDRERQDFEERVITGYETRRDTAGNTYEDPIYEVVRGTAIEITEVKQIELRADIRIQRGSNNCQYNGQTYYVGAVSEVVRIQTEGDQRAIPRRFLDNRTGRHERDDDMVEVLIEEVYALFTDEYF